MRGLEFATCHLRVPLSHGATRHSISYLRGCYRRPNLNDVDNTDISNLELKIK